MADILIEQTTVSPPCFIQALLLDHVQLGRFFNARFKLVKQQNPGEIEGGKGAIREVTLFGYSFKEAIITATNNHIHYQIIGNKPVKNHSAHIWLKPTEQGCKIKYHIQFTCPWFLPSRLLTFLLTRDIKRALLRIAEVTYAS